MLCWHFSIEFVWIREVCILGKQAWSIVHRLACPCYSEKQAGLSQFNPNKTLRVSSRGQSCQNPSPPSQLQMVRLLAIVTTTSKLVPKQGQTGSAAWWCNVIAINPPLNWRELKDILQRCRHANVNVWPGGRATSSCETSLFIQRLAPTHLWIESHTRYILKIFFGWN